MLFLLWLFEGGAVRDVDDCCCSWGICHFIFKAAVVLDVGADDDVAVAVGVVLVVVVIVVAVISSYTVRLFSLGLKIILEKEKKIETSNSCKRISFSHFLKNASEKHQSTKNG